MKIQKSRIFTADIYEITWQENPEIICGLQCKDELIEKDALFIRFGSYYVPVQYVKNAWQYFDIKINADLNDKRCLIIAPTFCDNKKLYISQIKPYFNEEGKVSLKELAKMQHKNQEQEELIK